VSSPEEIGSPEEEVMTLPKNCLSRWHGGTVRAPEGGRERKRRQEMGAALGEREILREKRIREIRMN